MRTYQAKPGEIDASWYVIDASGLHLGRLATRIAHVLRGKHKPTFTPHVETGDYVVVVNASKIELTGSKLDTKRYYRYSGYPGGLKAVVARTVRANDPERMLRQAVKGMLPKNRLASRIITKLKVYDGAEHPHVAQQPSPLPEVF
ncbi:MAG TPA: 50S ribosomal protein L13 [Myxococcota bacterium]|nr:50S ribosomal protein L13 [Myxococcota bacterium]